MEQNTLVENSSGSNAVTAYSGMKRNIPGGLSIAIIILYNT
jgi:hypothetical protein